jgi:putative transposase
MDSSTHEVRAANWKAVVTQCQSRPKGQTIAEWCKQNDIKPNTYYYWQRQVRKQFYQEMTSALPPVPGSEEVSVTFAEVPIRPSGDQCAAENSFRGFCPDAVICKGNLMVGLTNHVSDHILDRIMERINHVG